MTSAGAFLRALAAAKPPNPPPTITTRRTLAGILVRPLARFSQLGRLGILRAELEQSQQHFIPNLSQLVYGAAFGLLRYAVDDGLLNPRTEFCEWPEVS